MTDTGVPQICPIGNALCDLHKENRRWYAPEAVFYPIKSGAPAVWSFGMTIYVRL